MDDLTLFPAPEDKSPSGVILTAANATIQALQTHGALDATHSLKVALIREGARALDREMAAHKVTIAAMNLFAKVVDVADGLPTVQQAVDKSFQELTAALADSDD